MELSKRGWKIVSVPYRGAIFLNDYTRLDDGKWEVRFPSPIGELYFSILQIRICCRSGRNVFPSPIGELYFSMFFVLPFRSPMNTFPSPIGELYFSIPSLKPCLFSVVICRFAWQIVFSGNIAFFGMNFCSFSQCLCGAWETPAKFPDFCFFDSFALYDSFGCNVISHCPIMYSLP